MDNDTKKYIINVLRSATITWKGRGECLNRGRRQRLVGKYKDGRDKFVWEAFCESCGVWRDQKDNAFQIDHKIPVGSFTGDWNDFIEKLFCSQDNLQRLCISCHLKKTTIDNSTIRFKRKKLDELDANIDLCEIL